jgi:hypothetical protein
LNILPGKFYRFLLPIFCSLVAALPCAAIEKPHHIAVPIVFEMNQGQAPPDVAFLSRSNGIETVYRPSGIDIQLPGRHREITHIEVRWLRALSPSMHGEQMLPGRSNYLIGSDPTHWRKAIPQFGQVRYQHLYPGIDLVFHGSGDAVEHDFLVRPESSPSSIAFAINRPAKILGDGSLEIATETGSVRFAAPVAYQDVESGRRPVHASFRMDASGAVSFRLGSYDHRRALVIDPVLTFATYLSGTTADTITAVTTDRSGNIYVTGTTGATDFPLRNAEQATNNGNDAFVSKLDPTGHTLLFSTFLGGSQGAVGGSIAIDGQGNIVVAGTASGSDFPKAGAIQSAACQINGNCFFLASFKPDGASLNYAGLVGGTSEGGIYARMALDAAGSAYLTGNSWDSHFSLTPGTYGGTTEPQYATESLFVLKVDATGKLIWSTLIPGNSPTNPAISYNNTFLSQGIAVDASGLVTVAGTAGPGLPTTTGALAASFPNDPAVGNASAGFLLQLNSTATALNYATYLPGTDTVGGLAIAGDGSIYIAGATSESTLPVSSTAYQKAIVAGPSCSCNAGYVMKLGSQAKAVAAATYLSGTPSQGNAGTNLQGIALDSHSNVLLGGMTGSVDFPLMDPLVVQLESTTSSAEMVLGELSPDLSKLQFGTFLSSTTDLLYAGAAFNALAVDPNDRLIVSGYTYSPNFPTTSGSFEPKLPSQPSNIGYAHAFLASLDLATRAPSVCLNSWSVSFGNVPAQTTGTQTVTLTNCGNAPLHLTSYTSTSPLVGATGDCSNVAPAATCAVVVSYLPENSDAAFGTLTLTDDAAIPTQVLSFAGQGMAGRLVPARSPVDFGHLLVGTRGPQTILQLSNQGTSDLIISSVAVTGDYSLSGNTCIATLPKDWPCQITLTFAPTAAGTRGGSLVIRSNDPQSPQLTVPLAGLGDTQYATASITSIDPPTVQVGLAAQKLQITGANFYPASVVNVNGAPQTTTFVNNALITATLNTASVAAIGEVPVTVSNPAPGGGTSNPVVLTPYQALQIGASALLSVNGTLYAAIPASSLKNPNTILPIDPLTGKLGTPIAVGNDPRSMTASDDGKYIYVYLFADGTIQRVNLKTSAVERTFSFPTVSWITSTQSVSDMHAVPGANQSLIVSFIGILALYNDAGLVGVAPNSYPGVDVTSFTFATDPATFYGLPLDFRSNAPEVFTLNSSGIHTTVPSGGTNGIQGTGGFAIISDGTLLYTTDGSEWDPKTSKVLGHFTAPIFNQNSAPNAATIAVDRSSAGRMYFLGDEIYSDGSALILSSFDKKTFKLSGFLPFEGINYPFSNSLTRWGTNGFAFIAPGAGQTDQEIYILSSSLNANPTQNPQPTLASMSPSSAAAGGAALTLTLNGTGFVSTSTVTWNQSPLATTFVTGTQLKADLPAAEVSQPGTALVEIVNPAPGGGESALLNFTITAPAGQLSFSPSQLSFGNESVGAASAGQSVTVTNSGSVPVSIANLTATDAFFETDNCGAVLAPGAACQVSVTFLPTSAGDQAGSLTIADSAVSSPQTVALSGTGIASAITIGAASGGSTSATVESGQTATYNLSLIAAPGLSGTVALTCTSAPAGATCSINPAALALTSGQTSQFTVSVSTNGSTPSASILKASVMSFGAASFLLLPLYWSRRRIRPVLLPILLVLACGGAAVLTACGGSQSAASTPSTPTPPSTPTSTAVAPGNYTLQVVATDGTVSVTQALSLTVQ